MAKKTLIAIVLSLSLPLATASVFGQANTQGNSCGGGCYSNHDYSRGHNYGLYSSNCGKGISTQQAAELWSNYCNEDCSFGGGCRHRCRLFSRLFSGGCFGGCNSGCDTGCDSGYAVSNGCGTDGGYVGNGCGCDSGFSGGYSSSGSGCFGGGHGCGLLRGLFGRLGSRGFGSGHGCGCGCYQGCFGYPNAAGGCCGAGGFGGCGCGGVGHLGSGLARGTVGVAHAAKSKFCCLTQGVGRFASGIKNSLRCGLFRHGCHGIGCYGYNGGYFYNAPITTSQNFGFYAAGCSQGCDAGGCSSNLNYSTMPSVISNPNGASTGCNGSHQPVPSSSVPVQQTIEGSSFSPAGEIVPGQVVGEGAAAGA